MKENQLGAEKISKLFFIIVIPSMIAMVVVGVQSIIGGVFLGNYVGSNAMASVNIALPYMQSVSAIGLMLSIGATAFLGRTLGASDYTKAKTIFRTAFLALLFSGVFILFVSLLFGENIAELLGANDILLDGSTTYIKTICLFTPFSFLYFLSSFVNRLIGKPHLFVIGTIVSIVVNVTLTYIFIVELSMGIRGAALASGIAHICGVAVNALPFILKSTVVNIYEGTFNWKDLVSLTYNGSSEGVTSAATAVTTWVFNLTFMHYYGESGVAAFTIICYIAQLSNSVIFGVVDGVSPIISYNYGAKFTKRVRDAVSIALICNFAIGAITYIVIFFFGEPLIGMFADGDAALVALTYSGAKLYGTMFFLCGINILASSYFTAIGDAFKSIVVSASRGLIFILVGITILPYFLEVTGVWLVAPFADLITLGIVLLMVRRIRQNAASKKITT